MLPLSLPESHVKHGTSALPARKSRKTLYFRSAPIKNNLHSIGFVPGDLVSRIYAFLHRSRNFWRAGSIYFYIGLAYCGCHYTVNLLLYAWAYLGLSVWTGGALRHLLGHTAIESIVKMCTFCNTAIESRVIDVVPACFGYQISCKKLGPIKNNLHSIA